MRMRKKKHLDERLALCDNLLIMKIDDRNEKTAIEKKEYIDFPALFGNDNPVYLEIGCGKGGFCIEAAKRFPDINFLAVEKAANVMVTACENGKDVKNLRFLLGGAEYLPKFLPPESISLPFSKKAICFAQADRREVFRNL